MKAKYFVFAVAALLLATGGWIGKTAWRAKRQLVTLDVYQMPLREVLRKVESQTRCKIRAEEKLDAKITLRVKNHSLTDVLDKIAMQAGARWSTVFAIYNSKPAISSLETALNGDGKVEAAGWTRLAPKFEQPDFKKPEDGPIRMQLPPGGPPPEGGGERRMMVRKGPAEDVMAFSNGDEVERWSPEELLAQSTLTNRIAEISEPTKANAESAAAKSNAKVETLIAFRKSIMGIGFTGGSHVRGAGPGEGPGSRNARFANLAPEQRVLRARERAQRKPRMITEDVEK